MTDIMLVPSTVRWAREYRGVSVEDAAKVLKSVERLHRLEAEGGPITSGEFKKLAKKYRLSEATLAMPKPPKTPPPPEDFRTLDGRDPSLSLKTREAYTTAYERQVQLAELRELTDDSSKASYPAATVDARAEAFAIRERIRLGFTAPVQRELGNPTAIFHDLRARIEDQGVAVYVLQFSLSDCRGFSLAAEDMPPAIVVNSREHVWGARNFTLMHEYAHLLLHRPGISDERGGNRIERWCNAFAAEFLMGSQFVKRQLERQSPKDWDTNTLRTFANSFGVSQQAFALRLETLGLALKGYFDAVRVAQERAPKPKPRKGGDYVNTQLLSLGPRFTRTVFRAFKQDRIGPVEATRLLKLSPEHFSRARKATGERE